LRTQPCHQSLCKQFSSDATYHCCSTVECPANDARYLRHNLQYGNARSPTAASTTLKQMHQQKALHVAWGSPLPWAHRPSAAACLRPAVSSEQLCRRTTQCAGFSATSTGNYTPPSLRASEIARGLTNADLHLRQHYDEHINWDMDKEESRIWRRTVSGMQAATATAAAATY
jgi:hypothetical protein